MVMSGIVMTISNMILTTYNFLGNPVDYEQVGISLLCLTCRGLALWYRMERQMQLLHWLLYMTLTYTAG